MLFFLGHFGLFSELEYLGLNVWLEPVKKVWQDYGLCADNAEFQITPYFLLFSMYLFLHMLFGTFLRLSFRLYYFYYYCFHNWLFIFNLYPLTLIHGGFLPWHSVIIYIYWIWKHSLFTAKFKTVMPYSPPFHNLCCFNAHMGLRTYLI